MSPKIVKRQECLVYSRVCGWLSSTGQFNKGKLAEYKDRKVFEINEKDFK